MWCHDIRLKWHLCASSLKILSLNPSTDIDPSMGFVDYMQQCPLWLRCTYFLPLSPQGRRGIVIPVQSRWEDARFCGMQISQTTWHIFSVGSSMELSTPEVVQYHAHFPICPMWAWPWAQQVWHQWGPDFAECISLKLLDRFTPLKVLWNCLDL